MSVDAGKAFMSDTIVCEPNSSLPDFTQDYFHLFGLNQGFDVGGTNRVRHHREGVAFESMGDGHVFCRTDKRFGTDHGCRSS